MGKTSQCIICSSHARFETIQDLRVKLCPKHSSLVEVNIDQLIENAQDTWQRLIGDEHIARRNALFELIKICKLVKVNG